MRVTVGICTWNRAALLAKTLERMRSLVVPSEVDWELLIVNNNSTDTTEQVVADFADRLPIRYLIERQQGLSFARNRLHEAADGELICWTDDDVLVDAHWLAAYVDAAKRWPSAGYFAGRITPWFEHQPPEWLLRNHVSLAGMLVMRDLGAEERPLGREEWPFGANMAFRRAAIVGARFDTNLGLVGGNTILGEETEYCRELAKAGVTGVWVPGSTVQHWVGSNRMTLGYVRKYFSGYGRGKVRASALSEGRVMFGAPRWLYREYVEAMMRSVWRRALGRADWIDSYIAAADARGAIIENRAQRKKR